MRPHPKNTGAGPTLLLELPFYPSHPLVFKELFGNSNPVEVEIGCGKCTSLIARARNNPGINFLGIDQVWRYMKVGVSRAEKQRIPNIRFIRMDARRVIDNHIPAGSIDIFHIYYPDPWPKPRDHKHRLLNRKFILDLNDRLHSGGRIEIATDDFEYFIAIQEVLAGSVDQWLRITSRTNQPIFEPGMRTNYEVKYLAEGRSLYYLEVVK